MNTNPEESQEILVLNFVKAFQDLDIKKMLQIFDKTIVMYVANAQAGVDKVKGRDQLIKRIQEVDYSLSDLNLNVPQIVTIEEGKVMMMVHIRARKDNMSFENFAAFLCYIKNNKITHIWQVEANPAHSDKFWRN